MSRRKYSVVFLTLFCSVGCGIYERVIFSFEISSMLIGAIGNQRECQEKVSRK